MIITLALYMALSQVSFEPVKVEPVEIVQVYENRQLSESDFNLLCALVYSEAGGECYEGQVAVAEVVINRLNAVGYPKTLKGVIFQPNQFCGVTLKSFGKTSHSVDMAVRQALKEPMFQSDVVFYANVKTATDRYFINEVILKNEVCRIGNHAFAREVRR